MTTTPAQIPVVLLIDVEPDDFFIDRDEKVPWTGFERALEIMADLRPRLAHKTGHDAHFTWLVRADAQVAETYHSSAWAFEYYRQALESLLAAHDEVGLHVHAYRWDTKRKRWIDDYGNQEWVNHCVHLGVHAFERVFRCPPSSFSMGMDWTNQATIQLVSELGIRYEFSPILAKEVQPFPTYGTFTGVAPDCSRIPQRPYQPSPTNFLAPAAHQEDGMWIFPQSSRVAEVERSWKRRLYDLARLQPAPAPCTRKFFLQDDPAALRVSIDDMLNSLERPYLTFAVRTHEFTRSDRIAIIRRNLDNVVEHPAVERFVFTTPAEGLQIVGSGGERQGRVGGSLGDNRGL
jgi:hypothetical protein